MFETFLSYLALYGLKENIFVCNVSGPLQIQREKMYRSFRYLNALFLVVGIIITSLISYVLNNFVYSEFDLFEISVTVIVFIVALYNLLISFIWQKNSYFKFYLYENSFSYGFDVVYTLSVIFTLDMSVAIGDFLMILFAIALVIMIMNVIVGFYIKSINRGYININFRNVSARLFLFAIFSILLYYMSLLLV